MYPFEILKMKAKTLYILFLHFLQVLEYWANLLKNILTSGHFETFSNLVQTLITFDLILALKISVSDFEQRHLHKTFIILKELREFVRLQFPSLTVAGNHTSLFGHLTTYLNCRSAKFHYARLLL